MSKLENYINAMFPKTDRVYTADNKSIKWNGELPKGITEVYLFRSTIESKKAMEQFNKQVAEYSTGSDSVSTEVTTDESELSQAFEDYTNKELRDYIKEYYGVKPPKSATKEKLIGYILEQQLEQE